MPRDERRRQKALMKKRSKQKAAAQHSAHSQQFASQSVASILRQARSYPVYECLISDSWQKDEPGLVEIVLARQQPGGDICFGVYLVDKLLLGLKNTFARANYSPGHYHDEINKGIFRATKSQDCPIELAHQMIYQSIDYAAQFGFEPNKDFATSQFMLQPRGELEEPYHLTFGKNGKPLYISGPHDNPQRIIRQLEKTAGPGNYDYIAMMGSFGDDF